MPIVFAILPFFSTLLGGWAALRLRHRLHPIMAFAAGVLVATALVDLLPEASEQIGEQSQGVPLAGAAAILGFLLFSAMEAFVHRDTWEHQHPPSVAHDQPHTHERPEVNDAERRVRSVGVIGPIALIVHSTLDGLAIGLGFRTNVELGLVVAMAVLAHDFADGMNVVTLALRGGLTPRAAWIGLLLDAAAPVAGALLATQVELSGVALGTLLGVFAGVFLAIGASHLLPEAQHGRPVAAPLLVLLAAVGAGIVVAVRTTLP
jgi:ZIP family zinc transporter